MRRLPRAHSYFKEGVLELRKLGQYSADGVSVFFLLFGCLFLFLGIIGSYLARTYVQSKDRPVYIEKEMIQIREEDSRDPSRGDNDHHG